MNHRKAIESSLTRRRGVLNRQDRRGEVYKGV
jgi:hypothetical protein